MLVINCIPATGAQILSILLGVIVFITVPIAKNATTTHIAGFENDIIGVKSRLALDKPIIEINNNIRIFITATTLITGGYLPGNFPPIDAAPHGKPAARHAWKIITIPIKIVKIIAAVFTIILVQFVVIFIL